MLHDNTKQITNEIIMVRPAHFGFNAETAESNVFQNEIEGLSTEEVSKRGLKEFDDFVSKLRDQSIHITIIEDTGAPIKPDAIFPNNWITTHESGTVITYPMFAQLRRAERREDIVQQFEETHKISKRYSFDYYENKNQFLEGTGSMVLDRLNKIVYACLSNRTDIQLLEKFVVLNGYQKIVFHAVDPNDVPIYHTNVMMSVGETFVLICWDCIPEEIERKELQTAFERTGKEVIELSFSQIEHFAGNMLQVEKPDGTGILIMSESAFKSLEPEQVHTIQKHTDFMYAPIPTIEAFGGGSVRCMIAENFLPRKKIL